MNILVVILLDRRNLFQWVYLSTGEDREKAQADAWEQHKNECEQKEEEKVHYLFNVFCIPSLTEIPRLVPRLCHPLRQQ